MGFFRLLLRPRWRLFFFGLVALGLQIALLLISPAQVPVVLYKLALVMLAAILGMFFDVAVFPFATPDSYLDDDWKRALAIPPPQNPERPGILHSDHAPRPIAARQPATQKSSEFPIARVSRSSHARSRGVTPILVRG